jgi:hypothetical protein
MVFRIQTWDLPILLNDGKAKITNKTQSFLIKVISYLQEE